MPTSRFARELARTPAASQMSDLLAAGVTRGTLRGPQWTRTRRGIYAPVPRAASDAIGTVDAIAEVDEIGRQAVRRICDCLPLLRPPMALGGWAAAFVLGADWLDGIDPVSGAIQDVDITGPAKRRGGDGVRYRHTAAARIVDRHGIAVTCALQTAVDAARWSGSPEAALVVLDAMLHFGLVTRPALQSYVEQLRSLHGLALVRRMLPLARTDAWSANESRLRYCYRVEARLPDPALNVRLYDQDGMFLGRPDLFDPDAALAVEFDGRQHREREQHRRDNIREERMESAGVTVVRVDNVDLRPPHRPALVHRMRDGYGRGLGRDRRRDRWLLDGTYWDRVEY